MIGRHGLAYLPKAHLAPSQIDRRVADAAAILEIGPYLDRKPRQLSVGQRQRVAMGRALVREPAAFLFDEPLSNLDAKLRVSMRGEIRQLQKRLATTFIYVTHDQVEAMTLADRLVVLNAGQVEQIGRPIDVYRRPASTFVAAFIGAPAMNLLSGVAQGGTVRLREATLPVAQRVTGPVTVGVRPEDLRPTAPGVDGALPLRVSYVEELGPMRLVRGRIADEPITMVWPSGEEVPEVLHAAPAPQALHLFDAATGRRLD